MDRFSDTPITKRTTTLGDTYALGDKLYFNLQTPPPFWELHKWLTYCIQNRTIRPEYSYVTRVLRGGETTIPDAHYQYKQSVLSHIASEEEVCECALSNCPHENPYLCIRALRADVHSFRTLAQKALKL